MTLAERIRDARERAGMSRKEVAEAANVSPEYITSIEQGRRGIKQRHHIASLAHALGIPVDSIYADVGIIPHDLQDRLINDPTAIATIRVALNQPTPKE